MLVRFIPDPRSGVEPLAVPTEGLDKSLLTRVVQPCAVVRAGREDQIRPRRGHTRPHGYLVDGMVARVLRQKLRLRHVEGLEHAIQTCRVELLLVVRRREAARQHGARVVGEGHDGRLFGRQRVAAIRKAVPLKDLHGGVPRSRRDQPSHLGRDLHRVNAIRVRLHRAQQLQLGGARVEAPAGDGAVLAAAGQSKVLRRAVLTLTLLAAPRRARRWRRLHGMQADLLHTLAVKRTESKTVLPIPHAHAVVVRPGDEHFGVSVERTPHAAHPIVVRQQRALFGLERWCVFNVQHALITDTAPMKETLQTTRDELVIQQIVELLRRGQLQNTLQQCIQTVRQSAQRNGVHLLRHALCKGSREEGDSHISRGSTICWLCFIHLNLIFVRF
ncbi:hypothetical protein STCU_02148 [Strigomonas culicis]|uniref:Uncharacterized protein n=1 Tax=Strigomonas culicis TaxID=28005 RepID=S9UXL1_9TRYP|nr:hypothetical protein STCU_02148 [Strigomonas culicis]|eukprot:EPY33578.1 hypothetical protein STCU_02148 [Strigomonas culicis]